MTSPQLNQIVAALGGADLSSQIEALEKFFALPASFVNDGDVGTVLGAAVNAMETSSNPYPIAERLLRFGEEVISPVSDLLARVPPSEVRILAALILTNKGSRLGVPILIEEIEFGGEYLVMACLALVNAGVTEHVPAVIEHLRMWSLPPTHEFPTAEDDVILRLLDVLGKLSMPIPEQIADKFSSPQASQFFRSAVERCRVGHSPL